MQRPQRSLFAQPNTQPFNLMPKSDSRNYACVLKTCIFVALTQIKRQQQKQQLSYYKAAKQEFAQPKMVKTST